MIRHLILIICFTITATGASAQDYALLPDICKVKPGDTLIYRLFSGKGLDINALEPGEADSLRGVVNLHSGKKQDGTPEGGFSEYRTVAEKTGQNLLAFEFTGEPIELPLSDLNNLVQAKSGSEEAQAEGFSVGTEYIAAPHYSLKALTATEKHNGKLHAEKLGHQLEIILGQNPYKSLYGDDVIGHVLFKGEPLAGLQVNVYVKSANGNVYPHTYRTDSEGKFYFKLNRSGTWLVQTAYGVPAESAETDFDYWQSAYAFGFN